ncbi:hypothetical protein [Massilia sp. YIM B04103]|uniref:hypothetical protein n=1 Tax=Massilia sp. YIM B04103 TaxID=2963106 RepID=UPI0021087ED0|nr:hypothetical protein [Massilia sp. YIM B04103]
MAPHENYDEGMEHRITNQEAFAVETRERLARIEATLVTKTEFYEAISSLRAEMHKGFADTIKWVIGMSLGIAMAGITVMTFVLNNATPKTAPAQPAPVVIYLPAPLTPPSATSR